MSKRYDDAMTYIQDFFVLWAIDVENEHLPDSVREERWRVGEMAVASIEALTFDWADRLSAINKGSKAWVGYGILFEGMDCAAWVRQAIFDRNALEMEQEGILTLTDDEVVDYIFEMPNGAEVRVNCIPKTWNVEAIMTRFMQEAMAEQITKQIVRDCGPSPLDRFRVSMPRYNGSKISPAEERRMLREIGKASRKLHEFLVVSWPTYTDPLPEPLTEPILHPETPEPVPAIKQ